MSKRWLLPDGVEEILPREAAQIERLRRQILDLYQSWGYEFVIPPLLEFSDSLLSGLSQDIKQQTIQFGDRMSSRLLALRADITPQIARMDAHTLASGDDQELNRFCYVGSVVKNQLSHGATSRVPVYAGAELYGDSSVSADSEVITLMLETLSTCGLNDVHLDLGHVDVYRQLVAAADLNESEQATLFDAIQRKAQLDIDALLNEFDISAELRACLSQLASLHGDETILATAREVLKHAPPAVLTAIDELGVLAKKVKARCGDAVTFYFDLSELRAYGYHTGLVFSALVPGLGRAIAKGGRYDCVGGGFGRARPATGFQIEVKSLARLLVNADEEPTPVVALEQDQAEFWSAVRALRQSGEVVVCTHDEALYNASARQLVLSGGEYVVG
ncbi:MAG: ATP phosphoribosyltransferase regulatory subunit [Pseudomonadota bacterium]